MRDAAEATILVTGATDGLGRRVAKELGTRALGDHRALGFPLMAIAERIERGAAQANDLVFRTLEPECNRGGVLDPGAFISFALARGCWADRGPCIAAQFPS
jgi:NAD(P)-dependent dehydrogenase (short-subunit alcohol dehydrogenase family)